MTYTDTGRFITYYPPTVGDDGTQIRVPEKEANTGTVDMASYLDWLRNNGYNLGNLRVQ